MLKVGYVYVDEFNTDVYIGAVFITDERGIPLDFRYTLPVRPTKLQKVIYGKSLDYYLKYEVIMDSLLEEVKENTPQLWIVASVELLDAAERWSKGIPVIYLEETNMQPFDNVGDYKKIQEGEYFIQIEELSNPYRLKIFPQKEEVFSSVSEMLLQLASKMEILEPLDRMQQALALIIEEES